MSARELGRRWDSAAPRPFQPVVEQCDAVGALEREHLTKLLFEQVGAIEMVVRLGDRCELGSVAGGEVVGVLPQRVAGVLELPGDGFLAVAGALRSRLLRSVYLATQRCRTSVIRPTARRPAVIALRSSGTVRAGQVGARRCRFSGCPVTEGRCGGLRSARQWGGPRGRRGAWRARSRQICSESDGPRMPRSSTPASPSHSV